jgi:Flp pilus assembly protein TadG
MAAFGKTHVHRRTDEGVVAAFVLLLLVALFSLLGLVVDGGTALTAHQAAEVEAEQAARAGAGAISVDALRSGYVEIDPAAAIAAAEQFTDIAGHPGTAVVSGGVVTVHVGYDVPTDILGIVGVDQLRVSAVASAVDVNGVSRGAQ